MRTRFAPIRLRGGRLRSGTGALLSCLTAGLIWQFVLVVTLVRREQRTLGWPIVREALWLRSPRNPRSGRVGGRVWLIVIPLSLLFAAESAIRALPAPEDRDLGEFISSDVGKAFFSGAWGWFGLIIISQIFNTVLGEELLFRGVLLPRMNGAFGRGDWVANGVLFAGYHLHVPWVIPVTLLDTFILALPSKYFRSAWSESSSIAPRAYSSQSSSSRSLCESGAERRFHLPLSAAWAARLLSNASSGPLSPGRSRGETRSEPAGSSSSWCGLRRSRG